MKKRHSILGRAVAGLLTVALLLSVQLPMNLKGEDAPREGEELSSEEIVISTEGNGLSAGESNLSDEVETLAENPMETEDESETAEDNLKENEDGTEITIDNSKMDENEPELTAEEAEPVAKEAEPAGETESVQKEPERAEEQEAAQEEANKSEKQDESAEQTTGYDVTAPVIESVEVLENGRELSAGDMLHLTVKAYDAESGIRDVKAQLWNNGSDVGSFELVKTEKENEYTAEYGISVWMQGTYLITISITDMRGNVSRNYDCSFSVADRKVTLKSLNIDRQGETLKPGDVVKVEAELAPAEYMTDDTVNSYYTYCCLESGEAIGVNLAYNSETNKLEGSYKITEKDRTGKWMVSYIDLYVQGRWESLEYDVAEKPYYIIDGTESKIEVESISLGDAQGKFLNPGDTVFVSVKVKGIAENIGKSGALYFKPQIEGSIDPTYSTRAELAYNDDTGAYEGIYVLPEDIYPCEWCVGSLYVDYQYVYVPFSMQGKNYFNVKNQGTYVQSTYNIRLSVSIIENGYYKYIVSYETIENVSRRTTLRELLGVHANLLEGVGDSNGHKFLGWGCQLGINNEESIVGLDDEIIIPYDNYYISLTPKYDSYDVHVSLTSSIKREIYSGLEFSGWSCEDSYLDRSAVPERPFDLEFEAKYNGKTPIYKYIKNGNGQAELMLIADGENLDEDAIADLCRKFDEPEPVEGLNFKEWEICGIDFRDIWPTTYPWWYPHVSMRARYRECIVELYFEMESKMVLCVQPGEQFTLPTECAMIEGDYGCKNIIWYDVDTGEQLDTSKPIMAGESMLIYGTGDFVDYAGSEKPDDNITDGNTQGNSGQDDKTHTSKSELPAEMVEQIVREIKEASSGKEIKVNMKDVTVVPKEILEAAKGSNVNIVLDMGGYSWTINGKDITADSLKSINLEVKMDTNAVPDKIVDALSNGNPVRQLSLAHSGDFGFKASLSVNVGAQNSGQYGNLYYYDSSNKLIFQNAGKIDADGTVRLDFSHASDYVIVIGKSAEPDLKNRQSKDVNTASPADATGNTTLKSPPTGENASNHTAVIGLLMCVIVQKEIG